MDYINKILCGNDLEILPKLPAESVNCITCSPPYWGLRDYGIEPIIWDGDKNCKHDFSIETKVGDIRFRGKNSIVGSERNPKVWEGNGKGQFCLKCNAWRGSLGLEPTFELYIKHLCDIFDEVKRVLRGDGTCFVNIGDSYNGSKVGNTNASTGTIGKPKYSGDFTKTFKKENQNSIPTKSLCDIPYRFSIEMIDRGWIKRNTVIWWKPNCMPSSADDRFTIDFEYLFFFTKNNKAIFWTNEKTLECVDKKPPGTKGIEGKDWEWRKVGAVNESSPNQRVRDIEKGALQKATEKEIKNYGKTKWKKMSLWTGHDYCFEQQFEEHTTKDDLDRRKNKFWSENVADGGSGKQNKGRDRREFYGKQGRNKRCVWIIPTQPFPEAHFAVYPEELIEIPIKAGCPEFICKKCRKARVKIYERGELIKTNFDCGNTKLYQSDKNKKWEMTEQTKASGISKNLIPGHQYEQNFKGYSDCGCNAGFEPGIVLDPFMGSGTTAKEALKQRKSFIGIDIKQEYVDMSYRKIAKVQQRIF